MTTTAYDLANNQNRDFDDSDIEYPYTDGEPVAESDFQLVWLLHLVQLLKAHFQSMPEMYAAGNMFVYYERGNPSAVVAPDVFVVSGVENKLRDSFKIWEEGKGPDLVIEITSKSTAVADQSQKMGTYAFLGVREYLLFDPKGISLDSPFKFYRLAALGYELVSPVREVDGYQVYPSDVTGLEFHTKGTDLRVYDPATGTYYSKFADQLKVTAAARAQAEKALEAEAKERQAKEKERQAKEKEQLARLAAEKRIAELEAELNRLKSEK